MAIAPFGERKFPTSIVLAGRGFVNPILYRGMKSFDQWLREKDPELVEGLLGGLSKAAALTLGLGGKGLAALGGGAAGTLLGGPAGAIPGALGAMALADKPIDKGLSYLFPKATTDLMKKKMRKK